ncbi:MAG: hypothetical protein FJW40_14710 [Acidobacteria bacterium]|nr:hypothetical protein [Acidobacteriota bacterium]
MRTQNPTGREGASVRRGPALSRVPVGPVGGDLARYVLGGGFLARGVFWPRKVGRAGEATDEVRKAA